MSRVGELRSDRELGSDEFIEESEGFAYGESIITADVVHRVEAVGSRVYITDPEETRGVSSGNTQEGFGDKGRVFMVRMDTNDDAFEWVEIGCIIDIAYGLEGIYLIAGREIERVAMEWHFLAEVTNSISKIDGIGRAVAQGVLELDDEFFSSCFDFGCILLGRRHEEVRNEVVQLDIFVEVDLDPFSVEVECSHLGIGRTGNRRNRIFGPSLGSYPSIRTADEDEREE